MLLLISFLNVVFKVILIVLLFGFNVNLINLMFFFMLVLSFLLMFEGMIYVYRILKVKRIMFMIFFNNESRFWICVLLFMVFLKVCFMWFVIVFGLLVIFFFGVIICFVIVVIVGNVIDKFLLLGLRKVLVIIRKFFVFKVVFLIVVFLDLWEVLLNRLISEVYFLKWWGLDVNLFLWNFIFFFVMFL